VIKTGIGEDSHRFDDQRADKALLLGGVRIEGYAGLLGNSDADVVLHALTNAVSGITGVNVLGARSDHMCLKQGITDSAAYLAEALAELREYRLVHISVSIEARRPKLAEHIGRMRSSLARLCSIDVRDVGITATSGEGLTAFGRGEGIRATVVATAMRGEGG
jgi:2-C-methyl-D-erythritol 2,4-cyclodiphosphate synthase